MKNQITYSKQYYDEDNSFFTQLKIVLKWFLVILMCGFLVAMMLGLRIYSVAGWSMQPTFDYQSIIFDIKYDGKQVYEVDDIITYYAGYNESTGQPTGIVITHRIVNVKEVNGKIIYTTQGDNPALKDPGNEGALADIRPEQILGKVITINGIVPSIPKGMLMVEFLKKHIVDVIIVVVAAYIFFEVAPKASKYKKYEA